MVRPIDQETIARQTNKKQFFIFTGPKGRGQSQAIQGIWRSTRVSQEVGRVGGTHGQEPLFSCEKEQARQGKQA